MPPERSDEGHSGEQPAPNRPAGAQPGGDSLVLPPAQDHPAMFSRELIGPLAETIRGCDSVLDPFSGTGRIHAVAEAAGVPRSVGIELEPEWANAERFCGPDRAQIVGDSALVLPTMQAGSFGAVLTSPAYGNRMADKHEAKDSCKSCAGTGKAAGAQCRACKGRGLSRRHTYRHRLGRQLSANNGGGLQWGDGYREFHRTIWAASIRVLAAGGAFVVNCSNHIRDGKIVDVCGWHTATLGELGLELVKVREVTTRRQRHGANHRLRVGGEQIIVCRLPHSAE